MNALMRTDATGAAGGPLPAGEQSAFLKVDAVRVGYGAVRVLDGLDLSVGRGEFVAPLGASGCGKTTLLRTIAGFIQPYAGRILVGGRDVTDLPPDKRGMALVFQSYALWPHMTVGENIEYALKIRKIPAAERREIVDRALGIVGLVERRDSPPDELSGGQRQRVAMGRALVRHPKIFLFDEPLSNLDAKLRVDMRTEIKKLHQRLGATIVYVTHDQSEAMALADKVAVLDHGRLQQMAPPRALYDEPATAMVADFVGRGMVVPLDAAVTGRAGSVSAQLWGEPIHLRSSRGGTSNQACLRPEGLSLGQTGLAAKLDRAVFEGAGTILHCRVDRAPNTLLRVFHRAAPPAEGTPVKVTISDGWLLPAAA